MATEGGRVNVSRNFLLHSPIEDRTHLEQILEAVATEEDSRLFLKERIAIAESEREGARKRLSELPRYGPNPATWSEYQSAADDVARLTREIDWMNEELSGTHPYTEHDKRTWEEILCEHGYLKKTAEGWRFTKRENGRFALRVSRIRTLWYDYLEPSIAMQRQEFLELYPVPSFDKDTGSRDPLPPELQRDLTNAGYGRSS
jgi:hypothetical protein